MKDDLLAKVVALAKRRGFAYPGSDIYGGLNGTWDLGPVGVELARNIKQEWLKAIVRGRDDVVEIDSSVILNPKVWEASGHIKSFTDPLIECKNCHARFREDNFPTFNMQEDVFAEKWTDMYSNYHKAENQEDLGKGRKAYTESKEKEIIKCPNCFEFKGYTPARQFNLMFKTFVGPVDDEKDQTYLRPETAQGIFINFKNVLDSSRVKIPFGIAQIGKGFRNEITTGNFLFRVREFEMMELEFFTAPEEASKWHEYWKEERLRWYLDLGIKKENIKLIDLPKEDLAHYSKGTAEVHYNWPFMEGFGELEGIANRGDYDLKQHQEVSGKDMTYFEQATGKKYLPYVIEPSVGVGRAMLAFLLDAYVEEEKRVVLKLHPRIAPVKVAVFPLLSNKPELVEKAHAIYKELQAHIDGKVMFDDRGNIGKRYFYQDEIGTPFCVTVDFETLEDGQVTVRDRDTATQERVSIEKLTSYLQEKI